MSHSNTYTWLVAPKLFSEAVVYVIVAENLRPKTFLLILAAYHGILFPLSTLADFLKEICQKGGLNPSLLVSSGAK